jgi:hypothetical protein
METLQVEQTELLAQVVVGAKVALVHASTGTSITGEVIETTLDADGVKSIKVAGVGSLDTRNRWKDNDFWVVKSLGF